MHHFGHLTSFYDRYLLCASPGVSLNKLTEEQPHFEKQRIMYPAPAIIKSLLSFC